MKTIAKQKLRDKTAEPASPSTSRRWSYALILLVIVLFGLVRVRLRDMPLERDEGEYAYAGQLVLQGIPPYQLAYNMKLPGTYAAYAGILAVFGQTPAAVHDGTLLVNAAASFLVFLLALRLFGQLAAVVSGTSYALLSTSQSVLGFAGHATHFVVLPAVAGVLLFLRALESRRSWLFFLTGILMGLAFVMKQPGILFVFFGGVFILKSESKPPVNYRGLGTRIAAYSAGAIVPFAGTCLWMLKAGVFQKFWFWTFSYASQYGTNVSLGDGMHLFWMTLPEVLAHSWILWILALVGLTALWWHSPARGHATFTRWFVMFSFLAVCPGFYFRQHYFILMLPAVALLVGIAISSATEKLSCNHLLGAVPVLVFLAAAAYVVLEQREFYFDLDPVAACRATYGGNPFPEAIKIAGYIESHTSPDDRIAVLGSEPEIYFYSHRHSATGYIYTYPLMEPQKYATTMQKEMASDIEAARPAYLVYIDVPFSWLAQPRSDPYLNDWAKQYIHDQYDQVGLVDIGQTTEYHWGDEAKTHQAISPWTVSVFKRKMP